MIDANPHLLSQQAFNGSIQQHLKAKEALAPVQMPGVELPGLDTTRKPGGVFDNVIGDLIKEVDSKGKVAKEETNKMLLGQTDNIHQSMIAVQESSMAFSMLVEVRNKLVQSYQELMKMPV